MSFPIRWLFLGVGALAFGAVVAGAQTLPAAPAKTARAASPAAPKPPPPDPLPPSVPDAVNPFADPKTAPVPLRSSGVPASLGVDVQIENFDGFNVMKLLMNGPDFEWVTDPLDDWLLAPAAADESVAFVYKNQTKARVSLTLYSGQGLMPDINRDTIGQYLAAVRAPAPDSFALLTPFPKGDNEVLNPIRLSGFMAQGFAYAIANPTVLIYHVWIADFNHQYQLVVKLASPPALVDRFDMQVRTIFGQGYIRKGLGVKAREPAASPAGDSGKPPAPRTDG